MDTCLLLEGEEAHTQDGVAEDIEEEAFESDSDNANLLNIDLDARDGELLSNIREQPTTTNPSGNTKKFPTTSKVRKGSARNTSSGVGSKCQKKSSMGAKLYNEHFALVDQTSHEILSLLEDTATSLAPLKEKCTVKRSVEVIEELVKVNLLEEDSLLWCFAISEMMKEPCRHLFLTIPHNTGRLAWLKYRYAEAKGVNP